MPNSRKAVKGAKIWLPSDAMKTLELVMNKLGLESGDESAAITIVLSHFVAGGQGAPIVQPLSVAQSNDFQPESLNRAEVEPKTQEENDLIEMSLEDFDL